MSDEHAFSTAGSFPSSLYQILRGRGEMQGLQLGVFFLFFFLRLGSEIFEITFDAL